MRRFAVSFVALCAGLAFGAGSAPAAADEKDAAAGVNFDASKVTLDVKGAPLAEVLAAIAKQSGNRPLAVPDALREKRVTLSVKDASYWEAMDKACESAFVAYAPDPEAGALALREVVRILDVGARTGPFCVKVDRGSTAREFRLTKAPGAEDPPTAGRLAYNLTVYWEDRLAPLSVALEVTKALTGDGRDLLAGKDLRKAPPVMMIDARRARLSGSVPCVLQLPAAEGTLTLAAIEGVIHATFAFGEKTLAVKDVFAKEPAPAAADGVSLVVEQAGRDAGRVSLVVSAKREERSAPADISPVSAGRSFFLAGPDGKRYPVWLAGGTGAGKEEGRLQGAQTAELSLLFRNVPDLDGAWSLLFRYPGTVQTRDYPLKLTDVPLP